MQTIKNEAEALRTALMGGYTSVSDVIAWADLLIADDRGRDAPQLFDLALLRPDDVGRGVSLLAELPGRWNPPSVGRHIAKMIHDGLACGELSEDQAATALYYAMREGLAPDAEFETMAYYLEDAVSLVQQGVCGSLAAIRSEMLEYLARFNEDAASDE